MSDEDGTGHVGSGGKYGEPWVWPGLGSNLPDNPSRRVEERPPMSQIHLPWYMWMPTSSMAASPRGRVITATVTRGQYLQQQQYRPWYSSAQINFPMMPQVQEYSPPLSRFLPPPVNFYTMQLAQHYYRHQQQQQQQRQQQRQQLSYPLEYTYIAPPMSIPSPSATSEFRVPQLPVPRQQVRQRPHRQKQYEPPPPPPYPAQMNIPRPQVEPYNLTMVHRDQFPSSSAQIDTASPINIQHQQLSAPQTEPYDLRVRQQQFSPLITEERIFLTPEVEMIKISREVYEESWARIKKYMYPEPNRTNLSPVPSQPPAATQNPTNVIVINCTTEETALDILRKSDYLNVDHYRKRHLYTKLCTMIPALQEDPINTRRNKVRRKTAQYIQQHHQTFKELNNQIGDLITERDELRDTLKGIHGVSGMSVHPDFRQLYDQYEFRNKYYLNACYRMEENWKYWVFSLILDPMATSYNCAVSTDGSQDIESAALAWIDKKYSLTELKQIINSKIAAAASSRNMPSHWVSALLTEFGRESDNTAEENQNWH